MEEVIHNSPPLEQTFGLRSLLGARVLSKKGKVVGRVINLRIDKKSMTVEGLVVMHSLLFKRIYIDRSYFEQMTPESIVLSIEPSVLLKGKKVITYEGQVLGKVKDVMRINKSNRIKEIVVKPLLRKEFTILMKHIALIGNSVILKEDYHVPSNALWKARST